MEELDWPAQSHALNPIEHLSDEFERRLRARPNHLISVPDLKAIVAEWKQVPAATSSGKPSQKSEGCYSSKGGTKSILMPMILE